MARSIGSTRGFCATCAAASGKAPGLAARADLRDLDCRPAPNTGVADQETKRQRTGHRQSAGSTVTVPRRTPLT